MIALEFEDDMNLQFEEKQVTLFLPKLQSREQVETVLNQIFETTIKRIYLNRKWI